MDWVKILSVALAVSVALTGPASVLAQTKEPEAAPRTTAEQEADKANPGDAAYKVGAGVATAVNIPMRGALCGLGAAGGLLALIATFGSGYRFAARVVEEGCGGPWIITPEHLKGAKE